MGERGDGQWIERTRIVIDGEIVIIEERPAGQGGGDEPKRRHMRRRRTGLRAEDGTARRGRELGRSERGRG